MPDEAEHFAILRKALRAEAKQNRKSVDETVNGKESIFRQAVDILTMQEEVNIHLRFLAAHVIWQTIYSYPSTEECPLLLELRSLLPRNTIAIMDQLTDTSTLESTVFKPDFQLTTVDLSIMNGYVNATTDCSPRFLDRILPCILDSLDNHRTSNILDPYQHLYVLKNGLEKLTKNSSSVQSITSSRLPKLLEIVEKKVVRRYWDSRFSGCAELAVDCYKSLLRGLDNSSVDVESMIDRYSDTNRYPWYLRGKYRLLAVLVEFASLDQLSKCERRLLDSLRAALSATHVAPFSAAVYKTVLNTYAQKYNQSSAEDQSTLKRWVLSAVDQLLSENRTHAMHTSKYWIPAVAKYVPQGCEWIFDALEEQLSTLTKNASGLSSPFGIFIVDSLCDIDTTIIPSNCDASVAKELPDENPDLPNWIRWASVLIRRHARRWQRDVAVLDEADWISGLRHLDDDVRLETFSLLLDVSRKYEPLASHQYDWVGQFLIDNLIVSSSSFRRRLLAAYGKWITASVDFFAKQLTTVEKESLNRFRHFVVDSLLTGLFDHLFPGANYQRLTTALALLQPTLECLSTKESLWKFCGVDRTITENRDFGCHLLRCLKNSSEDIRRRSSTLLTSYFKFPFTSNVDDLDTAKRLVTTASVLCRSPKAIDCEAGCSIWAMLTHRLFVKANGMIRLYESGDIIDFNQGDRPNSSIDALINDIIRIMQSNFADLKKNLLPAAADQPLHGWASALATILELIRLKSNNCENISASHRHQLLDMACVVIDFMLNALGSPSEGLCPSLAEMQDAITASSIGNIQNEHENDMEEDSSIPLDQQLVLACCWLNIKAFASVLGELAAYSLIHDVDPDPSINRIGLVLFDAMSRTRHFGALDGCNTAFSKFLRLCMAAEKPEISDIPMKLLEKVLEHVSEPKRVSITRRSVGFPIMIECVVVAGWSLKKRRYLETAFQRLLNIAQTASSQPITAQEEKSDVSVVRAIHCLRLLLRSASLDLEVLPYVSACYHLAVHHFASGVWSIRNSAMLLLSSILWRLFGRREVKSDDYNVGHSENRMDLVEFCADFLETWRFVCTSLTTVASDCDAIVDSRLFALLCFTQNLIVTDVDGWPEVARSTNEVITALVRLLIRTPDARLKRIIADTLANFIPDVGDKRTLFFFAVRDYLTSRLEHLTLTDRHTLAQLMVSLKLTPNDDSTMDIGDHRRTQMPNTDDPVKVCRWLRNYFINSSAENTEVDLARLKRWVDGTSGLSAQCLSFLLLAKEYFGTMEIAIDQEQWMKRFIDFTNMLLQFIRLHQTETCRLAAACCFIRMRPIMTSIYERNPPDEIVASLNAELTMALMTLLSDEDEGVRYMAARSFTTSHSVTSLSPVLCLKSLFDECLHYASSRTSKILVERLLDTQHDAAAVEKLSSMLRESDTLSNEKNFLFAQQDFNIYKEDFYHLRLFVESLSTSRMAIGIFENVQLAPIELTNLCVAALEKLKMDVRFQRRHEECVFLIAIRILLRKNEQKLAPDDDTRAIYSMISRSTGQVFGANMLL